MIFAFMSYKRQFTDKAASLVDKLIQYKMLSLHLARIGDIALTPREKDMHTQTIERPIKGNLQLEKVGFQYAETEPFLFQDLRVEIKAGESVCFVGPSGCGKTTLMKIMLGLLEPTQGKVLVDGVDIRRLGLRNYRSQVASVMQDDQLLSGSIADNICFFEPNFDQKLIEEFAKLAAIHKDIMAMPMGYNSLIGDMGTTLSGGQKQRILMARALYKTPRLLFLDEATSHLDTPLESMINKNIRSLQVTRIIIAHRPETIASADRVILLKQGQIQAVDTRNIGSSSSASKIRDFGADR
jgi:ATP-binding cassette subfamily B protein RaxB